MSVIAGVDFGTLTVRVSIFDSKRGRLGADHATQSHSEHMRALAEAIHSALVDSGPFRRIHAAAPVNRFETEELP